MTKSKKDFRHKLPKDFKVNIESVVIAKENWGKLTPLARNEWICWVTSAKKSETREKRMKRAIEELSIGKKRPCCWPGCPHRREES